MSDPKQIIILRKDLKMRKGKMVAQGAHASMAVLLREGNRVAVDNGPNDYYAFDLKHYALEKWLEGSFTKICVSVNSEEELLELERQAKEAGLLNALITDAGATEFNGVPTRTALAIGPAFPEDLDPITGHLPLL